MSEVEAIKEPAYIKDCKDRQRKRDIEKWLELYPELDRNMINLVLDQNETWEQQYGSDYDAESLISQFLIEDQEKHAEQPDGGAGSAAPADSAGGEQRGQA